MKKFICLIVTLGIVFCSSMSVFAYDSSPIRQTSISLNERDCQIVSLIKNKPTNNLNAALKNYSNIIMSQRLYSQTAFDNFASATVYKTISISKTKQVCFYTDGTFAISILEEHPLSKPAVLNSSLMSFSAQYKQCSYVRSYYGAFSNLLYSITVRADFGYNGSSTWNGGNCYAYYMFGDAAFGTVSGWVSGYTQYHQNCGEVYGRGTFGMGFTVFGNSFMLAPRFSELNIICDPNGNISII